MLKKISRNPLEQLGGILSKIRNWGKGEKKNCLLFFFSSPFKFKTSNRALNKQNSIYTAIIFWIVRDLGKFTPDDFTCGGDKAELADVDLDDGTLGDDAKRRIKVGLRVFLDADDIEAECCL